MRAHLDTILRVVATGSELTGERAAASAAKHGADDDDLADGGKEESRDELTAAFTAAALPRRRLTRGDFDR